MPAILRIFPYQTDASLSVLGHIGSYGTIVGQGGGGSRAWGSGTICRTDLVGECAYGIMHREASYDHGSCE